MRQLLYNAFNHEKKCSVLIDHLFLKHSNNLKGIFMKFDNAELRVLHEKIQESDCCLDLALKV